MRLRGKLASAVTPTSASAPESPAAVTSTHLLSS